MIEQYNLRLAVGALVDEHVACAHSIIQYKTRITVFIIFHLLTRSPGCGSACRYPCSKIISEMMRPILRHTWIISYSTATKFRLRVKFYCIRGVLFQGPTVSHIVRIDSLFSQSRDLLDVGAFAVLHCEHAMRRVLEAHLGNLTQPVILRFTKHRTSETER